jgi:hypothetical protein
VKNKRHSSGGTPCVRVAPRNLKTRHAATLLAAATAGVLAGRSSADSYYFNSAINNSDWNSTADGYYSWLDTTTNQPAYVPTNGATAYVLQAGTQGGSGILPSITTT